MRQPWTFHEKPSRTNSASITRILAITLFSVLCNCILAYINHNITPLSVSHVVLCEGLMMLSSVAYLLKRGIYEEDLPIFLYLIFTLIITIYITVLNHVPFIDQFRNVLIIVCFAGIGSWASERTVRLAFRIGCFFVLLFLICEIVSTPFYVSLFHPGEYFENTRGIKQASFNNTGLFANALGFEGRFSFGLIDHRSSSLFLEQVSLANFCGVVVIYLMSLLDEAGNRRENFVHFDCAADPAHQRHAHDVDLLLHLRGRLFRLPENPESLRPHPDAVDHSHRLLRAFHEAGGSG